MSNIKQSIRYSEIVGAAGMAPNRLRAMSRAVLGDTGYMAAIDAQAAERLTISMERVRYFLGSVITTSKLLSFVNPGVFPIWGAVVHRSCRMQETTGGADRLRTYAEFTQRVHQAANYRISTVSSTDHYRIPEPLGKKRAAEFVMFFGGKTEHAAA